MTARTRASLQSSFENGDVPQGSDYADLIDSCVNLLDTSLQTLAGALYATEVITPKVSAANINITGNVSAANGYFSGSLNGATASFSGLVSAANANISGTVSANSVNTTTVSAADIYGTTATINGLITGQTANITQRLTQYGVVVSAAGTTQGTAANLPAQINYIQGISDGTATGISIPGGYPGMVMYVINETAVSGNIYPPTDGVINALATNAAYPLPTNGKVTIIHKTSAKFYAFNGA